jgi:hypothetical protein
MKTVSVIYIVMLNKCTILKEVLCLSDFLQTSAWLPPTQLFAVCLAGTVSYEKYLLLCTLI